MEREVSISVTLAVQLVALSAFLSLLFFIVYQGNTIRNDTAVVASDIESDVQIGFLNQMVDHRTDPLMPTATAYNIIMSYDRAITHTACAITWDNGVAVDHVHNPLEEGSCLINHMKGEVSMEMLYVKDTSEYIAFIHRPNCDWLKGNCDCPQHSGTSFYELKQKFDL